MRRNILLAIAALLVCTQIALGASKLDRKPMLNVQLQKRSIGNVLDLKVFSGETTMAKFVILRLGDCTAKHVEFQPINKRKATHVRLTGLDKLPAGEYELQVITKNTVAYRLFKK